MEPLTNQECSEINEMLAGMSDEELDEVGYERPIIVEAPYDTRPWLDDTKFVNNGTPIPAPRHTWRDVYTAPPATHDATRRVTRHNDTGDVT